LFEGGKEMKQCSICKQEKEASTSYFWASKMTEDGLHHECRPCAAEARRSWDRGIKTERKVVKAAIFNKKQEILDLFEQGFKKCSKCEETLPLASFHKETKSFTGLRHVCKQCESERKAA
jgi:hypothetical protein